MSRKTWLAIAFFVGAVLFLTRLDYLINNTFYSYRLKFSYGWYREYTLLYGGLFQLVIFPLWMWTHNNHFLLATEAFILSASQDLIYFGLWQGNFPTEQWNWIIFYDWLGWWTTANQFALSLVVNGVVFGFCLFQWLIWNHNLKVREV